MHEIQLINFGFLKPWLKIKSQYIFEHKSFSWGMDISKKEYFHNTSTLKPKSLMIVSSTKTPKTEPSQARYRGTIFIVKFHQSKTYKK